MHPTSESASGSRSGDDSVAVVTGAASGIGLATARRLQADGHRVVALDRAEPEGPADLNVQADVTDPSQVEAAIARVLDRFGRVDVLVNNAGITGSQEATTCHATPIDQWDLVMAVNVRGPFLCSRAVLPSMLARGSGHIITVASAAGLIAFPGRSAYTTSKGAAIQFSKSLAVDYAPLGIRANAVCPGMVETPMTQWRLDQPALREQVESKIPMHRVAAADEIADAIAVLASGRLTYMNGHSLLVDGGWTAV
jgi:NAD(P)-dependent dehydrogenase (short-subunit alcohol dehydrogenase family)